MVLIASFITAPVFAAQTGSIKGKVSSDAVAIQGATVTATSNVMPRARTTTVNDDGSYNVPQLIPGTYELTLTSASGVTEKATVEVLLGQSSIVDFTLDAAQDENRLVIVGSSMVIREGDSSINNSISQREIENLPVGESYRDLLKLIPGVQYSELGVLGPNAGGSGRDNSYGFDGVDVSLPMFGNLSAEPSTHDVQNVAIDRGAAKAVGFNRSGGFAIDTISKSGTNEFEGSIEYKIQDKEWVSDRDDADGTAYTLDKSWITASLSGPIVEDNLFFYASYYRPETNRVNKETAYGPVADYESVREEYYGKLTWAPIDDLLMNLSMRTSENEGTGLSVGAFDTGSTSEGSIANQDIMTFEANYIINDRTTFEMSYSEYDLETRGGPDTLLALTPALGDSLNLSALDQMGLFRVPTIVDSPNFDAVAAQALINQYGYTDDAGVRQGGGAIGAGSTINDQNFYRDTFEMALDTEFEIGSTFHTVHIGYQKKEGTEVLSRLSNGWGSISFVGGLETASDGTPIYYRSITQQMSLVGADGATVPAITSSTETQNIEIHDTIEDGDFTYDIGVLISNDILYGQGLKNNPNNVSGFELAPGHKYKMYEVDWSEMIQPRLGITWAYNSEDTVFANFAQYHPEASSLARAASWARNTRAALDVDFDINGNYIESEPRAGSSGKFFQEGIKPRRIDELTLGTTRQLNDEWYLRAHVRRREGSHFWEDTWNWSREYVYPDGANPWGGVPAHIAALGPYIPELNDYRAEVGGSSYVIAELDDAYTSYNEFNIEAEYTGDNLYGKISYVWSHYYGNYDQDITSGGSDANLFIGSSNLADGRGRQIWDNKEGHLYGDRPHVLKASGYYTTSWDANIGAYLVWQSGTVWNAWDGSIYGYSSSTIRNAEPAGVRREPSHWQLDLNYTQDFDLGRNMVLQFRADIFNVFDNQTGYNYDPYVSNTTFGQPRSLISPRRLRLSFSLDF